MKRRSLGIEKAPEIMIIPMIDIVFFLLVFFMLSTLYMNTEQQIPLSLPKASTSTAKTVEPMTISLTADRKVYLNDKELSKEQLKQELKVIVANEPNQAFVVRASKDIVYQEVVLVLDELKVQGAKYVSIATERK